MPAAGTSFALDPLRAYFDLGTRQDDALKRICEESLRQQYEYGRKRFEEVAVEPAKRLIGDLEDLIRQCRNRNTPE